MNPNPCPTMVTPPTSCRGQTSGWVTHCSATSKWGSLWGTQGNTQMDLPATMGTHRLCVQLGTVACSLLLLLVPSQGENPAGDRKDLGQIDS